VLLCAGWLAGWLAGTGVLIRMNIIYLFPAVILTFAIFSSNTFCVHRYLLSTVDKGAGMMNAIAKTPIDYLTWGNHGTFLKWSAAMKAFSSVAIC